jgi:hypothetical protein
MEQAAGFERLDAMPEPFWHDERVSGVEANARLRARRRTVSIVEDHVHRAAEHAEELIAVGVHLTTMRARSHGDASL